MSGKRSICPRGYCPGNGGICLKLMGTCHRGICPGGTCHIGGIFVTVIAHNSYTSYLICYYDNFILLVCANVIASLLPTDNDLLGKC